LIWVGWITVIVSSSALAYSINHLAFPSKIYYPTVHNIHGIPTRPKLDRHTPFRGHFANTISWRNLALAEFVSLRPGARRYHPTSAARGNLPNDINLHAGIKNLFLLHKFIAASLDFARVLVRAYRLSQLSHNVLPRHLAVAAVHTLGGIERAWLAG
jgi:hypothetical protein